MKHVLHISLILVLLSSCRRMPELSNESTDSTEVFSWYGIQEIERPVIVKEPGDTIKLVLTAPGNCDSCLTSLKFSSKSKRGGLDVTPKGNQLLINSHCKELEIEILAKDKVITDLKRESEKTTSVIIKPQKYIPWFWRVSAYVGWALSAVAAGRMVWWAVKKKFPLLKLLS